MSTSNDPVDVGDVVTRRLSRRYVCNICGEALVDGTYVLTNPRTYTDCHEVCVVGEFPWDEVVRANTR